MATIKDVARLAGVGLGTASRVVSGKGSVSPATLERVKKAIEQLDFRPSHAARSLLSGSSRMIGVYIPILKGTFYTPILQLIDTELRAAGLHMVVAFGTGTGVAVNPSLPCGACRFCREGRYGQCLGGGGWILGHKIDGTQAEYVRVPFADTSTYAVPEGVTDEEVLMLADIGPTGYEVGVLNGRVRPGDVVAVVGAGPVGLSAIMGARLFSPAHVVAIDLADARLEAAKQFGADITVNPSREDAVAIVRDLTQGLGADVAIEAVGVAPTFEQCTSLVRPGGTVANVGVHGGPATLHLEELWIKNVTITTGLVDTYSTPTLLRLLAAHHIDLARFVTHRFPMGEFIDAYDTFARAADTGALKVVLTS